MWSSIDTKSKEVVLELIAYKILGPTKVKLSTNTEEIWELLAYVGNLANDADKLSHKHGKLPELKRFNLMSLGYDIDF